RRCMERICLAFEKASPDPFCVMQVLYSMSRAQHEALRRDERLRSVYTSQLRREAWVPGMDAERLDDVTRHVDRGGREGEILWCRVGDGQADAFIAREVAHFSTRVRRLHWKVYAEDRQWGMGAALER